ncbi:MAG: CHAT domain-containing protein, partial [Microcoleus sp. SIO2G3]|nr:CHAT domain-containing protein [Microcoleus sp. SIO2G3]
AMGSLWAVSDEGTLALMTQFYEQLKEVPIKAEGLRQAQLAMLRGEVKLQGGQLVTSRGSFPLPPELAELPDRNLSHPYYWSAFTMIGKPW